jgi:ketosteroid isomerase-like protein
VLAVQLKDSSGRLERLQAALTEALSGGGWYASEFRRFFPHVTIARLGRGERTRADRLEAPPGHRFKGTALTLYRSWLGGAGAAYEPQRTIRLSEDPVEAVTRFHVEQRHAYAGGELEPLRARLTEDIVWHVPGRSRIAGDHRGIDDVLAYFDARRRLTDETFRITVHGVSVIDGRVVQLAGGTAVRNGRELCWETVGVFRVEDGRIAEAWLVPFDQQAFDEIWG